MEVVDEIVVPAARNRRLKRSRSLKSIVLTFCVLFFAFAVSAVAVFIFYKTWCQKLARKSAVVPEQATSNESYWPESANGSNFTLSMPGGAVDETSGLVSAMMTMLTTSTPVPEPEAAEFSTTVPLATFTPTPDVTFATTPDVALTTTPDMTTEPAEIGEFYSYDTEIPEPGAEGTITEPDEATHPVVTTITSTVDTKTSSQVESSTPVMLYVSYEGDIRTAVNTAMSVASIVDEANLKDVGRDRITNDLIKDKRLSIDKPIQLSVFADRVGFNVQMNGRFYSMMRQETVIGTQGANVQLLAAMFDSAFARKLLLAFETHGGKYTWLVKEHTTYANLRFMESHWTVDEMRRIIYSMLTTADQLHENGYCLMMPDVTDWTKMQGELEEGSEPYHFSRPTKIRAMDNAFQRLRGTRTDLARISTAIKYMVTRNLDLPGTVGEEEQVYVSANLLSVFRVRSTANEALARLYFRTYGVGANAFKSAKEAMDDPLFTGHADNATEDERYMQGGFFPLGYIRRR